MPKEDRHKMIKFCHPEANDGNMQQFIERYDKNNEQQRLMRESGVRAIGMKPLPGDSSLFTVRIPNSCYLIRMWDGGMDRFAQYCLDLYDSHRQVPVNLPKGYSLWPAAANIPGAFTVAGPLASWETDMGFAPGSFPEGEEKWSVPEGVYITVKRADRPGEDFTFAVPRRQHADLGAIAQPVRGYAP
ncbi:hypothetical protein BD309DRAFT_898384 [Dichomitus squalens]|uniref:Uncharacterized protein n=1 Tax=Dichomitus squalens TaxID=114155 RepID=A0A4Q9NL50_9APHY|nr:hypothetical protein BD309DRAFT_898384 [Dichomitus squalens]TBU52867.1 hypothetical protein BD310DRAFT_831293 [Dichomitus squalens]